MKLAVRVGTLRNDEHFQTIMTGYSGVIVNAHDSGSVLVDIENRNGRERKRLHPDIKVYVDSYGE